jgi:hypothetical protein
VEVRVKILAGYVAASDEPQLSITMLGEFGDDFDSRAARPRGEQRLDHSVVFEHGCNYEQRVIASGFVDDLSNALSEGIRAGEVQ